MNLHYIKLLFILREISEQTNEFSANDLATSLPLRYPQDRDALKSSNVKLISNDLARLYRMQLLSRRKIKREVNSGGYWFNRGFMYLYRLNKQGRSYIEYLKLTYPHGKDAQDHVQHVMMRINPKIVPYLDLIETKMGDSIDDQDEVYVEYVYRLTIFAKGRYRRFAPKIPIGYVKDLMERKRKLRKQNEKLQSKIEKLQSKIERLEESLGECRKRIMFLLR